MYKLADIQRTAEGLGVGNTRPYTAAHAVAAVDVALLLKGEITKGQVRLLRSQLGEILLPEGFKASGSSDGPLVGFARTGIAGESTEEVHVHKRFVHSYWTEYRGWTLTRDASIKRLEPVLALAENGQIEISAVGLLYTDVFFNDDTSTYAATDVFNQSSKYLPPFVFAADEFWEAKSNWFEDLPGSEECTVYSALGIEAKPELEDEDSKDDRHVTEISHRQRIFFRDECDSKRFANKDVVATLLDGAYALNRNLMVGLLSDEMLVRIGLKEEPR